MKAPVLASLLLAAAISLLHAETEEVIDRKLPVTPGGTLVVDVDFGAIDVNTHASDEAAIHVVRTVQRRSKAAEEAFLKERPVTVAHEGGILTVRSVAPQGLARRWNGFGNTSHRARYAITLPRRFDLRLRTSGGGIEVENVEGTVLAGTSGGRLRFTAIRGPVDGRTSGGSIQVTNAQGTLKVRTSGGAIQVSGGGGALDGTTSGGSVSVRQFRGPVQVGTSGGNIEIEQVAGSVKGTTSGGSIAASLTSIADEVFLSTSGGSVTLRTPASAAFDLEATTSGGGVHSDLPVTARGKPSKQRLEGPVNGGGKRVVLRTSGGSIRVRTL